MTEKCDCLDEDGKQCKNKSIKRYNYHGDNEIYDYFNGKPSWVQINVCKKHKRIFDD